MDYSGHRLKVLHKNKINLDQKIAPYFSPKLLKKGNPKFKDISFRQLLSFQSGMTGFYFCTYSAFPLMNSDKCNGKIIKNVDFRTGPGFEYSSLHMSILGQVLEKIEKKKWNAIFKDEFKKFYNIRNNEVLYYAKPKDRRGAKNPLIAGGLVLAPSDYLKFLRTLWQKGKFKRKEELSACIPG